MINFKELYSKKQKVIDYSLSGIVLLGFSIFFVHIMNVPSKGKLASTEIFSDGSEYEHRRNSKYIELKLIDWDAKPKSEDLYAKSRLLPRYSKNNVEKD